MDNCPKSTSESTPAILDMIRLYTVGCGFPRKGWPIHSPAYTNRLYYIYDGRAWFLHGSSETRLKPGHLYFFSHNLDFRVRQDEDRPVRHLYFDFALIPPFLLDHLVEMDVDPPSPVGHTIEAVSTLVEQYKKNPDDSELHGLIETYLSVLLSLLRREKELVQLHDPRLISVLEVIHRSYMHPISCRQMAAMVNMELNHFIRTFKKVMLMTPYQYVREYRLNTAAAMLETGTPINVVARSVGYENASSFSSAMKKSRGICPTRLKGSSL